MTSDDSERSDAEEARRVHQEVDRHPGAHQPTTAEEDDILRGIYGPPDGAGIFRETRA